MIADALVVLVVAGGGDFGIDVDFASPTAVPWTPIAGTWRIEAGEYRQLDAGFDLTAVCERRIDEPFVMTVKCRAQGGVRGAGILFGLRDRGSIAGAAMLRFDPDGVLFGEFDATRTFHPTIVKPLPGKPGTSLMAVVDPTIGRCDLLADGAWVGSDVFTRAGAGYVALQSSGGAQAFRSVRVMRAPPGLLVNLRRDRPLNHPSGIAWLAPDHWIVCDCSTPPLAELDRDGSVVRRFGNPSIAKPDRVAVASDGTIALSDGLAGRVLLVDRNGRTIRDLGKGALQWPAGLAFDAQGRLAVADTMQNRVFLFARDGVLLGFVGNKGSADGELDGPSGVAFDGRGRLVVADSGNLRYQAFAEAENGTWRHVENGPWLCRPSDVALAPNGDLLVMGGLGFYEDGGCLRRLRADGYPLAHFAAFAVGGLSPTGQIAVAPDGTIAITDERRDRIVFATADLAEPRPIVSARGRDLEIAWTPAAPGEPHLAADAGRVEGCRIGGLEPMQPTTFRVTPTIRTAPPEPWSKTYRALAPPPEGKTALLRFEVLVAIFLRTVPDGGTEFRLERGKLGDKVEREFEKTRRFYLRNSGFRVDLSPTFVVIESEPARPSRGFFEPDAARAILGPILAAQGKKLADFDSLVATWAEPGYDATQEDDLGAVGGGGLTPFAYSCFGMGGKLAWLFCHEFHHQLDSFFDRSGYPEYWLNHPDATVHPGRYGQHWDCNAFILRGWPRADWLACAFGRPILADDRDGDGVPDRDPSLALDEWRLGTDPTKPDTEGDGAGDLARAMRGTFDDPATVRPPSDVMREGSPMVAPIHGLHFDGDASIAWEGRELAIDVAGDRAFELEVQLDGLDDGWFTIGDRDNRTFRASAAASGEKRFAARVSIAADAERGPRLVDGARQGIAIRVVAAGHDTWLFDPWALWSFRTQAKR
jgi:hypothetical protein